MWLEDPVRFSLEPALQVGPGAFHTPADTPMFGAIGDSAPDRWGRALMRRAERRRAERAGTAPRSLQEIDFLLLVDDEARQGALRFAEKEGGPFLREEGVVEKLVHGSDYPVPPTAWFSLSALGWSKVRELERIWSFLARDVEIKRARGFPDVVFTNPARVLAAGSLERWKIKPRSARALDFVQMNLIPAETVLEFSVLRFNRAIFA